MSHRVVGSDYTLFRKKDDPQMESGSAFKKVLAQPPDAQPRMQMRQTESIPQRAKGIRNPVSVRIAEVPNALAKTRVKVDSHSLSVKGLLFPDALAVFTSALTAL